MAISQIRYRVPGNYVDYLCETVVETWLIAWLDLSQLKFARLNSFSAKVLKITIRRKDCVEPRSKIESK